MRSILLFFFNATATTEISTLSLHDALPIYFAVVDVASGAMHSFGGGTSSGVWAIAPSAEDRKSTRLNSSHRCISYAVFCLKKKKTVSTNQSRDGQVKSQEQIAHT